MRIFEVLTLFMFLVSCSKKELGDVSKNVDLNTQGVFESVTFEYQNQMLPAEGLDLDEYELGKDPLEFVIKVTNHSKFPITNMGVEFIDQLPTKMLFNFAENLDSENLYPGRDGTCASALNTKESCTLHFSLFVETDYPPSQLEQQIKLNFKNLVSQDSQSFRVKVKAGFPASLVFEGEDSSDFWFGEKVTIKQKPVVERAVAKTFHKSFTVVNKGNLRARNLNILLENVKCESIIAKVNCTAMDSNFQNTYLDTVWRIEHNCPTTLFENENCQLDVYFDVKNQDTGDPTLDQVLAELKYNAQVSLKYQANPALEEKGLNAFYTTFSTNIAAYFTMSVSQLEIVDPVVAGNRNSQLIRIDNLGYAAGLMYKLYLYNPTDVTSLIVPPANNISPLGVCVPGDIGDKHLSCYTDDTLQTKTNLLDFPFLIEDTQNCLSTGSSLNFIPADANCVFKINVQPSINLPTAKTFMFSLWLNYDSRKLEQVDFKTTNMLESFSFNAITAARLSIKNVQYSGTEKISPESAQLLTGFDREQTFSFGRVALLLPQFAQYYDLSVEFENIGDATAYDIKGYLGKIGANQGLSIPLNPLAGQGLNVGTDSNNPFYKNLRLDSNCISVPPGGTCTIAMSFAALALGDSCLESESMFDYFSCSQDIADRLTYFKKFSIFYNDGSNYSDSQTVDEVKDIPDRLSEVLLKAILVKKGYLAKYDDQEFLDTGVFGYKQNYLMSFRNIGSGPIPYIGAGQSSLFDPIQTNGLYLVQAQASDYTETSSSLDCLDIFDFSAPSISYADVVSRRVSTIVNPLNVSERKTQWLSGGLPSGESCVLRFELNPQTALAAGPIGDNLGFYKLPFADFDSTTSQSSWQDYNVLLSSTLATVAGTTQFDLFYYDGDVQTTTPTDDIVDHFGKKFDSNNSLFKPMDLAATFLAPSSININLWAPRISSASFKKDGDIDGTLLFNSFNLYSHSVYNPASIFSGYIAIPARPLSALNPIDSTLDRMTGPYLGDLDNSQHSETMTLGTIHKSESISAELRSSVSGNIRIIENSEQITSSDNCIQLTDKLVDIATTGWPALIVSNGYKTIKFTISSPVGANFVGGIYKCEAVYSFEYLDEVYNQVGPYIVGNPNIQSQRTNTKSIKLLAWIEDDAGAPHFKFKTQDFMVAPYPPSGATPPAEETLSPIISETPHKYLDNSSPIDFGIKMEVVAISDASMTSFDNTLYYAKKRIWIENISNIDFNSNSRKLLVKWFETNNDTQNQIDFSKYGDYLQIDLGDTDPSGCGHPNFGFSLDEFVFNKPTIDERFRSSFPSLSSCYFDIYYQPRVLPQGKQTNTVINLGLAYESLSGDFIEQAIVLQFNEAAPAAVQPVGLAQSGNTYKLTFPKQNMTENLTFDYNVELRNTQVTAASFVHQWINYKNYNLVDGSGNPILPDFNNCDISEQDIDCIDINSEVYRLVEKNLIMDNSVNIGESALFMNQACFVGDNDTNLNWSERGFSSTSLNKCRLYARFQPTINAYKPSANTNSLNSYLLGYTKFDLTYYDYNRGSSKKLIFAFDGLIEPSKSAFTILNGETEPYTDVVASQGKFVSFNFQAFQPSDEASLGSIVGYRIFISDTTNSMNDLYILIDRTVRDYIDLRTTDQIIYFSKIMEKNFKFYYFKIAAIRYNADYTQYWPDLNAGEYLSYDKALDYLTVVTPGMGYKYSHKNFRFYRTDNEPFHSDNSNNIFSLRKAVCDGTFQVTVSPSEVGIFSKNLLDIQGRDFLIDNPDFSCEGATCSTFGDVAVWLDEPFMNVSQYGFANMQGFSDPPTAIPNTPDKALYVDGDPFMTPYSYFVGEGAMDSTAFLMSKMLAQIYGRFIVTEQPIGVFGLLDSEIPLATSRCFVDLNNRLN